MERIGAFSHVCCWLWLADNNNGENHGQFNWSDLTVKNTSRNGGLQNEEMNKKKTTKQD